MLLEICQHAETIDVRHIQVEQDGVDRAVLDVQVPMASGGSIPLGEVASVKLTRGATSIRTENGQLAVYIFVDIRDRDLGGYVADAALDKGSKIGGECTGRPLGQQDEPGKLETLCRLAFTTGRGRC